MNRLLLILGAALLASLLACIGVYQLQMRTPPDEWLGRQLGLSGEKLAAFTAAHNRYAVACAEMCVKIRESDERLAGLLMSETAVTPEVSQVMARSDALRNECRLNMLAHFYEVAAMLEPVQRRKYLELVAPLIVEPDRMSHAHRHP